MNTKTKPIAWLMSLLTIWTMLSGFAVFASAEGYAVEVTVGKNQTLYESFEAAWSAAGLTDGAAFKLLADCSMGSSGNGNACGAYITKNITIDLNGHVLTPPTNNSEGESAFFYFDNTASGVLTIQDSNPTAVHWYYEENNSGMYVWDDAKTYYDKETNEPREGYCYYMIPGGALTGGSSMLSGDSQQGGGCISVNKRGRIHILGGNFIGNQGSKAGAIRFNPSSSGIAEINISGGLFIGNLGKDEASCHFSYNSYPVSGTVSGGTFAQESLAFGGANKPAFAEGYAPVGDLRYANAKTVVPSVVFTGVQQSADKTGLRLIAAVNLADITENTSAGFSVCKEVGAERFLTSSYYYTRLLAQETGATEMKEISPYYEGYVLIAVVITNIPDSTAAPITLTVTPALSTGVEQGETIRSAKVLISANKVQSVIWIN